MPRSWFANRTFVSMPVVPISLMARHGAPLPGMPGKPAGAAVLPVCTAVGLVALLTLWPHPAQAQSAFIGRVVSATGTMTIERPGTGAALAGDGAEVAQGDIIETIGETGARVRFRDNTELRLRPGTRMVVTNFNLNPANPAQEGFATQLFKGGLRAISGLIARRNPASVIYSTSTATVGIRGTDFVMRICSTDCVAERGTPTPAAAPPAARVVAARGSIIAVNASGEHRSLAAGSAVYQGEVLRTGADADGTLVFRDDARIALKAASVLGIERYGFDEARARNDSTVLRLFSGAFRAVTGALGRRNPASFRIHTATATVGIRGTVFDVVCRASCAEAPKGGRNTVDLSADSAAPNLPAGLRQRLIEAVGGRLSASADRALVAGVANIVVGGLLADAYVAAGLTLPAPAPEAPNTIRIAEASTGENAIAQASALALGQLAQQGQIAPERLAILKEALDAALTGPLFRERLAEAIGRVMTSPNPDWAVAATEAASMVTGAVTAAASGSAALQQALTNCAGGQCDPWRAQATMQDMAVAGATAARSNQDPLPGARLSGQLAGQALLTSPAPAGGGLLVRTESGVTTIEAGGRTTEVRADQTAFIANRQGETAFISKPAGMPGDDGQRPEDLRINLEQTFGTASSSGRGEPGFYTFVTEGSIGVREGGASELVVQAGEGSFTGAAGGLPRRTLPPAFLATDRFLSGTAGGGQVCMAQ